MSLTKSIAAVGLMIFSLAASAAAQDRIPWAPDLETAKQIADQSGRLVLVHFWSFDCPPCRRLEQNVFPRPEVARAIENNYVPVKVNVKEAPELARQFQVNQWPTDVVITSAGREVHRTVSPQRSNAYIALFDQLAARHRVQPQVAQNEGFSPSTPAARNSFVPASYDQAPSGADNRQTAGQGNQPLSQQMAGQGQFRANQQPPQHNNSNWPPQNQTASTQNSSWPPETNNSPYGETQSADDREKASGPSGGYGGSDRRYSGNAPSDRSDSARTGDRNSSWGGANSNPRMAARPQAQQPQAQASQVQPPLVQKPQHQPNNYSQNPYQQNPYHHGYRDGAPGEQPSRSTENDRSDQVSESSQPGRAAANQQTPPPAPKNPPLALDGYCSVTLVEQQSWQKGDARYGAIHRGRTFHFAGEREQQKFLNDPDHYAPALSGYDPVRFLETGQLIEGGRAHGVWYHTPEEASAGEPPRMYLFADEAALQRFGQSPENYAAGVRQAERNASPQRNWR